MIRGHSMARDILGSSRAMILLLYLPLEPTSVCFSTQGNGRHELPSAAMVSCNPFLNHHSSSCEKLSIVYAIMRLNGFIALSLASSCFLDVFARSLAAKREDRRACKTSIGTRC
jgi:hypothetical protein